MTLDELTSQHSRRMIRAMFTSREFDHIFAEIGHQESTGMTDIEAAWFGYELAVDSKYLPEMYK